MKYDNSADSSSGPEFDDFVSLVAVNDIEWTYQTWEMQNSDFKFEKW